MPSLTPDDMAMKLLADGFERAGPPATALSDPIADTPMVVTLDQLRPYEHNPRVTRNPLYDDIKASIRERGLDAPPVITRRPGEAHYIIRNGGNTRLAILGELWTETREERFFRIPCLFRPWSPRGEIVALTGHLAENELRGNLTFIERALAVDKARELYEGEIGTPLSQSELSRRLARDGYPVSRPHISRMQDAIRYLLPAIPTLLYGGLGRPQVERLVTLRRAAARVWEQRGKDTDDFAALFHDVLVLFDHAGGAFTFQRVQDELIGQMAERLQVDYDALCLDIEDAETRQQALSREPSATPDSTVAISTQAALPPLPGREPAPEPDPTSSTTASLTDAEPFTPDLAGDHPSSSNEIGVPPPSPPVPPETERLQAIRQLVAGHTEHVPEPDSPELPLHSVPMQAHGLYPITDVWTIGPALDDSLPLRTHIAQLAREIAAEAHLDACVIDSDAGIGYRIDPIAASPRSPLPFLARAILSLLLALTVAFPDVPVAAADTLNLRLFDDLAPLLLGTTAMHSATRLSDAALVKFYRLVRLARRLRDRLNDSSSAADGMHGAS